MFEILGPILKFNTSQTALDQNRSDRFGKPVRPVLPVSSTTTSSRLHQLLMQAYLHEFLILDNHLDSGGFIDLNFQKLGTSEDFPGGWVPAAILGTSEEIPGTSEVCTTRNTEMCVALGVCVKACNFPSSSHMLQLGLTSPMAKHLIDLKFCFSLEPAPIKPKCSTRERLQASYGKRSM
jgi:hypothetical protein